MASYVLSFIFDSPTKAIVFILSFHTIIPMIVNAMLQIAINVVFALIFKQASFETSITISNWLKLILGIFFPGLALNASQSFVNNACDAKNATMSSPYKVPDPTIFDFGSFARDKGFMDISPLTSIVSLVLGFIFYTLLLIMCETGVFKRLCNRNHASNLLPMQAVDDDVKKEAQRVAQLSDSQQALAVRNLWKYYTKNKCALADLTIGINQNECFGLLGVNGAVCL